MKRYDLSKIMKRAHNLYNNVRAKYQTLGEALAKSWKMAKFDLWLQELKAEREAREAKEAAKKEIEREERAIKNAIALAEIEAQRIMADAKARAEKMRDMLTAKKIGIPYEEYREQISIAMGYGRGVYCGD